MTEVDVPGERARAMRLLDHVHGEAVWREEPPVPDAASLGALDGFRLISSDEQVRINVYIYAELDEGTTTATALQEMTDGDVYHPRATVHGRLLCFAVARADDPTGVRLVDGATAAMTVPVDAAEPRRPDRT